MPSRSIIRTGVGPHREPGNRFPAMAAINLLAARAARDQSRRNLSRSLSPKLDHSHSITRFDRSRTGPKEPKVARKPRYQRPMPNTRQFAESNRRLPTQRKPAGSPRKPKFQRDKNYEQSPGVGEALTAIDAGAPVVLVIGRARAC